MKPFKTLNSQMKILRSRGLDVPSKAKRYLEDENYYNVVNGYKDLFLKKGTNNNPISPEEYIEGANFLEIYSLFKLDRRLRNILLEYLLVFETNIKSRISYSFSKKHADPHSYLYFKNYSDDSNKTKQILRTISDISGVMNRNMKGSLKHYIDNYNGVPLWVLINYLSFGTINYMYQNLEDDIRTEIAQDYNLKIKRQYGVTIDIYPYDIDRVLQQVNTFRNVCAHEERLYDFRLKKPQRLGNIYKNFHDISNLPKDMNVPTRFSTFTDLLVCLKIVLNKTDYQKMINKISKVIEYHESDFTSISMDDIYSKMGFEHDDFKIMTKRAD